MQNWRIKLFEELGNDEAAIDKQGSPRTKPFQIIEQDGNPFSIVSFSNGCFFMSSYFSLISLDETTSCALLEVLYPCCYGEKMICTTARILMDLSPFCGIRILEKPVFSYIEKLGVLTEEFQFSGRLLKDVIKQLMNRIEWAKEKSIITIVIDYKGPAPSLELLVNIKEQEFLWIIPKENMQAKTFADIQSITGISSYDELEVDLTIGLSIVKIEEIYL